MKDILKEGVRGAFVRIIRTIVYVIIGLGIFYLIGLISSSKVSALTYQGLEGVSIKSPGNNRSGNFNAGHNTIVLDFEYNRVIVPNSDLLGFRIHSFEIAPITNSTEYTYDSCTGYVESQTPGSDGDLVFTCTGNINGANAQSVYTDMNITSYAFVYYSDNSSQFCWTSSEVQDTFLCPVNQTKGISKVQVYIEIYSPNISGGYYFKTSNNYALYNYDNTSVVQQQQQTNTYLQQQTTYITNDSVSGAISNSDTALGGLSNELDDMLNGWGGEWSSLTHVVLEPINVLLNALSNESTCSPISLTIPYINDGQTIVLPCMSGIYNQYFGTFITLFMSIMAGLYSYRTILYVIRIIKEITDAENDKLEVVDL